MALSTDFVEKYKEEVNLRIGYINDLREKNNSTERLDLQFEEYNKILGELNDLGNDPNNIYRITKGVDLGKNVQGKGNIELWKELIRKMEKEN